MAAACSTGGASQVEPFKPVNTKKEKEHGLWESVFEGIPLESFRNLLDFEIF